MGVLLGRDVLPMAGPVRQYLSFPNQVSCILFLEWVVGEKYFGSLMLVNSDLQGWAVLTYLASSVYIQVNY